MSEKLKAYYGLPEKIKFCIKCSISNQRPNSAVEMKNKNKDKKTIAFNEEGVCSACSFNSDKKSIDWKEREKKLFELLEPYRSEDGSYDVLVPSSGGKDSAFAAHVLKYKYKMHVNYDPCSYPGIQVKYYYNENNNLVDGVCSCPKRCSKKGNDTPF